ncbi:type IA DNA topoisomerase [Bacillus pseudomycoides]|uniref:type IA DNA topoisomerase n=1 Tax=Bacillus pseudomycoides TaxID=64104 RepID=UPI000BEC0A23|nr:type IA DNA topoisomerase [Bacillus pseudomycoides]PEB42276.1 DNA topoisomerase III [Bacillus pseudomycoides]
MGVTVILAEKPKQAMEYSKVFKKSKREQGYISVEDDLFPNGAVITWAIGHLVELELPTAYGEKYGHWKIENLPLIPKPNEFKKKVDNSKKEQFNVVNSLLNKCSEIIVASDAGREGELIAYSIIEKANAQDKPIKRMWCDQLVDSKIREAFENLREKEETYGYYIEAQTRQYADWVVGMNGSPLISILINKNYNYPKFEIFSLGRVQTPALFMIYELDQKIDSFVSTPFFELHGLAETESGTFSVELKDKRRFGSKEELNKFLKDQGLKDGMNHGRIKSVEKSTKEQKAPTLYNLTDLQKEASKKYGFTAKKVLATLQNLYDNGFVSYPRTDSRVIGETEFKDILKCRDDVAETLDIKVEWVNDSPNKAYVDDSKVEEHSALMVTSKTPDIEGLTQDEKAIYKLIAISNLKMFLGDYVYDVTKATVTLRDVEFIASGKTDINLGWKVLNSFLEPSKSELKKKGKEKEEDKEKSLPILIKSMPVDVDLKMHSGKTKPPQRMTEARLLELMENPNIEDEEDKKVLKKTSGIGTVATRADIIERLKSLSYISTETGGKLVTTAKGKVLCESLKGTLFSSAKMTANWERYLENIHNGKASQDVFLEKIAVYMKELIKTLPTQLEAKKETTFAEIKKEQEEKEKIGTCPNCGKDIVKKSLEYTKDDKKVKNVFYGCTGYDTGCKFSLPVKFIGKTISETNVKALLKKGVTGEIKGFKSKDPNKKDFSAKLKLTDKKTGKIEFDFSK